MSIAYLCAKLKCLNRKQALKNVNKNQPVKSTRYGTNESGYKANSSFISNKSGSSNYYIMNKNKTKHKVRQKNNSMHLANSDQLNVSMLILILVIIWIEFKC